MNTKMNEFGIHSTLFKPDLRFQQTGDWTKTPAMYGQDTVRFNCREYAVR
jgi:hypothetical protein